jgi:L-lysine 6-transaminase
LTNTDPKKTSFFPKFNWPRITNPKLSFKGGKVPEDVLKQVIEAEKKAVAEIEEAIQKYPDEIAALIIEPIQGEGGDNHFRAEFLRELRKLADKHDFLLIFDEVQCGFGTTGKWWAWQHFGVLPDIFSFGKKTQVCGICAQSTRLDEVDNVFKVSSRINSTWGGTLVDMVRCQRYIEIIEQEHLLENATKVGQHLLNGLIQLEKKFPVTNARGKGMFLAIDLPDTDTRNKVLKSFYDHGCLSLSCGPRSVRLRPPLSMTIDEATELLKRFESTFADMWPANSDNSL